MDTARDAEPSRLSPPILARKGEIRQVAQGEAIHPLGSLYLSNCRWLQRCPSRLASARPPPAICTNPSAQVLSAAAPTCFVRHQVSRSCKLFSSSLCLSQRACVLLRIEADRSVFFYHQRGSTKVHYPKCRASITNPLTEHDTASYRGLCKGFLRLRILGHFSSPSTKLCQTAHYMGPSQ